MPQFDGLISFLDSRSFGTIWFWLVVIGMWSATGRNVLGVPTEIVTRARHAQRAGETESAAVVSLLDWLSLVLPRWQLGRHEGVVFLAVSAFFLTSLAIFGFRYGLEMAQALTLLLVPFLILFWMRVRLARRLVPLLAAGQEGERPVEGVGAETVRLMIRHRRLVTALSVVAVALTALWGMLWELMHPNGL
ncbi:hypothetical protein JHW45_10490 [Paracoccus stylophorae]|uniref:Component of SufBCD complex n=1 Tax=Paracoccus stylophorae TaxID=659350 RepID=A0ABY7SSR7_9RHOB|nr:hypothetical protein [Paracoccus stylophorae]WCR09548.1 hypothetical protein JHW45_10490 [Paracoccus stylophorae]